MIPAMGNAWRRAAVTTAVAVVTACAPIVDNASSQPQNCKRDELTTLYPGIFTVGTDEPAYPPWYLGDDPANG